MGRDQKSIKIGLGRPGFARRRSSPQGDEATRPEARRLGQGKTMPEPRYVRYSGLDCSGSQLEMVGSAPRRRARRRRFSTSAPRDLTSCQYQCFGTTRRPCG